MTLFRLVSSSSPSGWEGDVETVGFMMEWNFIRCVALGCHIGRCWQRGNGVLKSEFEVPLSAKAHDPVVAKQSYKQVVGHVVCRPDSKARGWMRSRNSRCAFKPRSAEFSRAGADRIVLSEFPAAI